MAQPMNQPRFSHFRSFALIVLIVLVTGCVGVNPTLSVTSTVSSNSTGVTGSVWGIMENWPAANQIRAVLIDQSGNLWTGGPGGVVHWDLITNQPMIYAIHANPEKTNVVDLSQTPDHAIWVGTFGNGLSRFEGTNWQSFTTENGLPGNYLNDLTVTPSGEIWLVTKKIADDSGLNQEYYFGRFEDNKWINEAGGGFSWIVASSNGQIVGAQAATNLSDPISMVAIYDGHTWQDLVYDAQEYNPLRRKAITALTVAPDGVIWVATLDGIYRYVNQTWTSIMPPWIGKDESVSVSSIAISPDNTAWFGFSFGAGDAYNKCGVRMEYVQEQGVYRYDGKTWTRFTTKDGLVDNKICAITLDSNGNVWVGSFDKGVSRFNGQDWISYVIP
jgi:ligand-binding sensor domain-containing protein